ncbi:unnamed protein product [Prunus armeniaca]
MSQGGVARHGRAEGKGDAEFLKLACRMTMCLCTGVLNDRQSFHVARVMCLGMSRKQRDVKGNTKLAYFKAM